MNPRVRAAGSALDTVRQSINDVRANTMNDGLNHSRPVRGRDQTTKTGSVDDTSREKRMSSPT
ncbi:hypothetical protein [Methanopyrus kandleri]|uniref:Uncharacterized protein n=1 Tax=Methanopyrus kandleri TaxID=2320 RepID=A0A832WA68_9EURY|nr:hypothetical protein [Methanopyrus kandleri]HII69783.1 hypothetical protein [Methanopyrus kandleri]